MPRDPVIAPSTRAERTDRDALGRWRPGGPTANPKGRPPGFQALIRARLGRNGEKLVDFLCAVLDGTAEVDALATVRDGAETRAEIVRCGPTMRERLEAAKMLRDSGFGRPALAVEVSGPDGGPIPTARAVDVDRYDDAQLAQLEALLERGAPQLPAAGEVVEGEVLDEEAEGDE
jgi:hypothetical protein